MARNKNSGSGSGVSNPAPKDPSDDQSSPYFVHPSDDPATVTVTPMLSVNGSNYHSWARSMRRALGGKNKYDFVDGSIAVLDSFDPSYKAWSRFNMLAHSWIMNSGSESIGQSIVFLENAIDVWNELKERFSQGNLIRTSGLQCEIYSLKQGSLSVTEFFSELKVLWEELESYMPEPRCGCPRKCIFITGIELAHKHHELNKVIHFVTGLNENFAMIRSQILLMEPLPKLNKIFSMVFQYERQFCNTDDSKTLAASIDKGQNRFGKGNYSGSYAGNNGSRNTGKVCTHCGRVGHTIETCYKKHGFPPNWQKNVSNVTGSSSEVEDSKDHDEKTVGITKEQCEKLVNMLQATTVSQGSNSAEKSVNIVTHCSFPSFENNSGCEDQGDDWFGYDA